MLCYQRISYTVKYVYFHLVLADCCSPGPRPNGAQKKGIKYFACIVRNYEGHDKDFRSNILYNESKPYQENNNAKCMLAYACFLMEASPRILICLTLPSISVYCNVMMLINYYELNLLFIINLQTGLFYLMVGFFLLTKLWITQILELLLYYGKARSHSQVR